MTTHSLSKTRPTTPHSLEITRLTSGGKLYRVDAVVIDQSGNILPFEHIPPRDTAEKIRKYTLELLNAHQHHSSAFDLSRITEINENGVILTDDTCLSNHDFLIEEISRETAFQLAPDFPSITPSSLKAQHVWDSLCASILSSQSGLPIQPSPDQQDTPSIEQEEQGKTTSALNPPKPESPPLNERVSSDQFDFILRRESPILPTQKEISAEQKNTLDEEAPGLEQGTQPPNKPLAEEENTTVFNPDQFEFVIEKLPALNTDQSEEISSSHPIDTTVSPKIVIKTTELPSPVPATSPTTFSPRFIRTVLSTEIQLKNIPIVTKVDFDAIPPRIRLRILKNIQYIRSNHPTENKVYALFDRIQKDPQQNLNRLSTVAELIRAEEKLIQEECAQLTDRIKQELRLEAEKALANLMLTGSQEKLRELIPVLSPCKQFMQFFKEQVCAETLSPSSPELSSWIKDHYSDDIPRFARVLERYLDSN
jgi:hypothetical protein